MTVNFKWTDEHVETLIAMVEAGDSRGVIATHFGLTRNAVCGKVDRLKKAGRLEGAPKRKPRKGHKRAARPSKRSTARKPSAKRPPKQNSPAPSSPAGKRQEPSTPPCEGPAVTLPSTPDQAAAPGAPDLAVVEGTFILLEERTAMQCCFPIWSHQAVPGDPLYGQVCGAPVRGVGQPYCAAHATHCENPRSSSSGNRRSQKGRLQTVMEALEDGPAAAQDVAKSASLELRIAYMWIMRAKAQGRVAVHSARTKGRLTTYKLTKEGRTWLAGRAQNRVA